MRLENQPGIIVVHYWAGKEMKHNYSDTVEDSVNIILKVSTPSPCSALLVLLMIRLIARQVA